jgi:malate dehydrogenase (oxaloacetate-decarboxylating)(NADP+)
MRSAGRLTGQPLVEQRVLFLGAGAAATGIAQLLAAAMTREGLPEAEARARCWLVDEQGLLTADRAGLPEFRRSWAHPHAPVPDLAGAVEALRPTALIGVSGAAGAFTEAVIRAMARANPRPIIFPLSNPTSKAECTAEQAYAWSEGRAIVATGSRVRGDRVRCAAGDGRDVPRGGWHAGRGGHGSRARRGEALPAAQ